MDENLVKSILSEELYQELINLDKRTTELNTCKIPKNNEPIDILKGCVPVIPKFNNVKELKEIDGIIGSILSDSALLKESDFEEQRIKCLNVIQTLALNLSKSVSDKSNANQFISLQKILLNLIEITVYNTILEKNNKSEYCFNLSLNADNYYSNIPRIKNYYKQSGIRSYDIHDVFDDIIRSVSVRKEYKNKQDVESTHVIKYFADLNELSAEDIGDGSVDIKLIIYSRLLIFKQIILKVLNEMYNSANTDSLLLLKYTSISGMVDVYFNNNISKHTNKKLTSTISLKSKNVNEIIEYFSTLNISLQKNLSDYFDIIDMFDINQIKYKLVYELSNIPCTSSNKGFDISSETNKSQYKENLKNISKNSDNYNIFLPTYWMIWTIYLNIISLIPTHWTVGFITPVGSPVKLPIIYIHLLTIPIGSTNIIIWLSINGIVISPVVMVVDGKTKSTWEVLFRGGKQLIEESQGSKPIPTGFNIPQSVDDSQAVVDTNTNATELAPMLEDAFPPMERMSPLNPAFLKFLNTCCDKGKTFMGLQ